MSSSNRTTKTIGAAVAVGALTGTALAASAQAEPQGYDGVDAGVALVYGTFNPPGETNQALLVGGDLQGFCEAGPTGPGPGEAPARLFSRNDGTLDAKINDKGQPAFLYEQDLGDALADWLPTVCAAYFGGADLPEAVAEGTVGLKVRDTVMSDDLVEVFNSVNGFLVADDETRYRVKASADFDLVNGVPDGDPADFVSFDLTEIGG